MRPSKKTPKAPFLLWDWRPDLLAEVLAALTPQNCRVDILSSTFGRAGEVEAKGECVGMCVLGCLGERS